MYTRVLLDVDGVLVNFVDAVRRIHLPIDGEWPPEVWDLHLCLGTTESDMWRRIDANGEKFWVDLEDYPWADSLVDTVKRSVDEWYIATSPSRNPLCASGKVRWIQSKFGSTFTDFFLGSNKFVMANSRTVLIDDRESNIEHFREAGGYGILFPQPWNSNRTKIDPSQEFGGRLQYVEECLHKAVSQMAEDS